MPTDQALSALIPEDHPMAELTGKQVVSSFFMPLDEIGPCTWIVTEDGHAFGIASRGMEPVYCHVKPDMIGKLLSDVEAYAVALAGNAAFSMRNLRMAREHFSDLFENAGPHSVDDDDDDEESWVDVEDNDEDSQ